MDSISRQLLMYGGAASAPAWTPLDIADCMLWLDADDPATLTMGTLPQVAAWQDKSVSALSFEQATPSLRPELNTSIYTRPCMEFEYITAGTTRLTSIGAVTVPTSHTVFIVNNWNARSRTGGYGSVGLLRGDAANSLSAGTAAYWVVPSTPAASPAGGWQASLEPSGGDYAYEAVFNSHAANSKNIDTFTVAGTLASATLDVNGVSKTLTTAGGPTWSAPTGTLTVGAPDSTYGPMGSIAEVIMYSRVLTSGEIATVQAYLAAKWI